MNYASLGFKCGVEIHQRLDTHKLFCNCYANPSQNGSGKAKCHELRRTIRSSAGELGKVDAAARFEAAKKKETLYLVPEGEACLVECDDEPPHDPDEEALKEASRIAKALEMNSVNEVVFMRKTVADGSAVSGFQRTALLATGGEIEGVGIQTLCLEEESAGIVRQGVYRLDRLGIPLVEIATEPDIKNGEKCRRVCEALGLALRANARVQRGLGSIRQDVNVSIRDGARVEIKGVQDLKSIPELVENEVLRQQSLSKIKKPKKVTAIKDVSKLFEKSKCRILKGKKVYGFSCSLQGELKKELHPGKTLGNELAGYARANGSKGIIHSDEDLSKYPVDGDAVRTELGEGLFVLCAEKERALQAVRGRVTLLGVRIPEETRRANGVKSGFMRPLPGKARMYPETDVPTFSLKPFWDAAGTPKSFKGLVEEFKGKGLGEQLAEKMARSPKKRFFNELVGAGVEATTAATALLETVKELKRRGAEPNEKCVEFVLNAFRDALIVKSAIPVALERGCIDEGCLKKNGLTVLTKKELARIAAEYAGKGSKAFGAAMKKYRLRADPKQLKAAFEKELHG